MHHIAWNPCLQVIFVPWAMPRPQYQMAMVVSWQSLSRVCVVERGLNGSKYALLASEAV
jgi:hypothetical protein